MTGLIVLRAGAGVTAEQLGDLDGRWYALADVPYRPRPARDDDALHAEPTGEYETRGDGARAEIWRVTRTRNQVGEWRKA